MLQRVTRFFNLQHWITPRFTSPPRPMARARARLDEVGVIRPLRRSSSPCRKLSSETIPKPSPQPVDLLKSFARAGTPAAPPFSPSRKVGKNGWGKSHGIDGKRNIWETLSNELG